MGKLIKLLIPLGLVAAAATWVVLDDRTVDDAEATLARVASGIAQRPVEVSCTGIIADAFDVSGDDGHVEFDADGRPGDTTTLKRGICKTLADFQESSSDPSFDCVFGGGTCSDRVLDTIGAIHTLAYESWHLRGVTDDGIATCYAAQTTAWTARRLGADPRTAQATAVVFIRDVYPTLPASYQSSDCKNGGRYDLNRGSAVWP